MVSGDPRAAALHEPVADGNAPCGRVDLFDFPLDPPHADSATRGGGDFGVYRQRYDKYHAGEDWGFSRGGSNLGKPVYSIGHGLVTYAEPLGWGRDQGVVIVRHTYEDGRTVLSFYGHLEPDSIVLRAGECVTRGQQVGTIGKPRGAPHLHFEVRTHLPYTPGGGYWAEDPTLAGWLPPSETIWNGRLAASPGVLWTQLVNSSAVKSIDSVSEELFIMLEAGQLLAANVADGAVIWSLPDEKRMEDAAVGLGQTQIYLAGQVGQVEAFSLADLQSDSPNEVPLPLWSVKLDAVGIPLLLPLPEGGVVVSVRDRLFAISDEGALLWESEAVGRPFDWLVSGDSLLFSTVDGESSLWSAGETEVVQWAEAVGGHLAADGDRLLLLDRDALYELDPQARSVERILALPLGRLESDDIVALPGGDMLLVHTDFADRRLIALKPESTLRWERSIAGIVEGDARLLVQGDQAYLVSQGSGSGVSEVSIFGIDLQRAELTLLFSGGTRSAVADRSAAFSIICFALLQECISAMYVALTQNFVILSERFSALKWLWNRRDHGERCLDGCSQAHRTC